MSSLPANTIQVTSHFHPSAERVFDTWLDSKNAGKWLLATPKGHMIKVEIDPRVGGSFNFTDLREEEEVAHTGEYLQIDRPRRLAFTFGVKKYSPESTRVSIEIIPSANGCELILTHEGVLPEYADRTKEGWTKILQGLADLLSKG